MANYNKQEATTDEIEQGIFRLTTSWNLQNPSDQKMESYWRDKQREAVAEGYKAEVCSCGATFLAFSHFVRCQVGECPMSDGVSIVDRWLAQ